MDVMEQMPRTLCRVWALCKAQVGQLTNLRDEVGRKPMSTIVRTVSNVPVSLVIATGPIKHEEE